MNVVSCLNDLTRINISFVANNSERHSEGIPVSKNSAMKTERSSLSYDRITQAIFDARHEKFSFLVSDYEHLRC